MTNDRAVVGSTPRERLRAALEAHKLVYPKLAYMEVTRELRDAAEAVLAEPDETVETRLILRQRYGRDEPLTLPQLARKALEAAADERPLLRELLTWLRQQTIMDVNPDAGSCSQDYALGYFGMMRHVKMQLDRMLASAPEPQPESDEEVEIRDAHRTLAHAGIVAFGPVPWTREFDDGGRLPLSQRILLLQAKVDTLPAQEPREPSEAVADLRREWRERFAALAKERDALRDEVEDWRASAAKAAGEGCGDEKHCTCVGPLRKERDEALARAEKAEADSTACTSDCDQRIWMESTIRTLARLLTEERGR